MSSIPIRFQLDDKQPVLINLPPQFTLNDFEKAAADVCPYKTYLYSFVCHGKELNLRNETEFNEQTKLISPGTTIFIFLTQEKCFLSDTLVQRSDLSEVPISDVKPGDTLLAFTDFGEITTTIVEDVFIHEVDQYIEAHFGDKLLHVTREHPFFIGNGIFIPFDKLRINDCVYNLIDGHLLSTPITSIKTISAPATRVYNLCTAHPHTYFANGIAVHNKRGMLFVNMDKKDAQRITWSTSAPSWRIARPGICLEGRCNKTSCAAYKQLVIINIGIIEKFDLLCEGMMVSKCPECSEFVEPLTCAFNNCDWNWEGIIQYETGTNPKEVKGEWKHADNAYHRFDQDDDNDTVRWLRLIIKAKAH